jgi:class III poly(R)-hydroxyalkanoic acid synthase PhaE subunit
MINPNAWQDLQRQFAQAWSGAFNPGLAGFGNPHPLDWMQAAQSGLAPEARAAFDQAVNASRSFLQQAEQLSGLMKEATSNGQEQAAQAWQQAVEGLKQQWAGMTGQDNALNGLWQQGLQSWNQFAAAAGAQAPGVTSMPWLAQLSLPPVGYSREQQERQQEWLRCAAEYAAAQQAHAALLQDAARNGLDLMAQRGATLLREGQAPDTPRKVYDLWVDCTEEAYATLAAEPRFAQSQGRMMSAMLRLKEAGEVLLRPALAALGAVDTAAFDTLSLRLHELRREVRALREQLGGAPAAPARKPAPRKPAAKPARRK